MRRLVRELRGEARKVRRTPLVALPGLFARYVSLHVAQPRPRPATPRSERIVLTLSTIPSRVRALGPVLRSLLHQDCPADAIWLALPAMSRREGRPYPPVRLPDGVERLECEDLGPATKLVPALRRAGPTDLVIAVDDDVVYPRDFVATLLAAHRADPDSALGYRGWRVEPGVDPRAYRHWLATDTDRPVDVDILLGTWGLAVQPRFFGEAVSEVPEGLTVDDVWFSGLLKRAGVPRRVVPAARPPLETWASRVRALTDGPNRSGEADAEWIARFWPRGA